MTISSRDRLAVLACGGLALAAGAACHGADGLRSASAQGEAAEVGEPAPPSLGTTAGGARCPARPMALALVAPPGPSFELLALAADGVVTAPRSPTPLPGFRVDERGCLLGDDGVEVEVTPEGDIWTLHSLVRVRTPGQPLGEGDVELDDDGAVLMRTVDSPRQELARIEGYRPEGRCAALLLVGAFLLMMPSMAVADGVAPVLDAPEGSACLDLPRPAPSAPR